MDRLIVRLYVPEVDDVAYIMLTSRKPIIAREVMDTIDAVLKTEKKDGDGNYERNLESFDFMRAFRRHGWTTTEVRGISYFMTNDLGGD